MMPPHFLEGAGSPPLCGDHDIVLGLVPKVVAILSGLIRPAPFDLDRTAARGQGLACLPGQSTAMQPVVRGVLDCEHVAANTARTAARGCIRQQDCNCCSTDGMPGKPQGSTCLEVLV